MTAASSAACEIALERPALDVVRGTAETVLILRGMHGTVTAWLDERQHGLVAASIRYVTDARALGGLSVTIDIADPLRLTPRRAAAILISSSGASIVLAMLGRDDQIIAAVRLDTASIDALSEAPA